MVSGFAAEFVVSIRVLRVGISCGLLVLVLFAAV